MFHEVALRFDSALIVITVCSADGAVFDSKLELFLIVAQVSQHAEVWGHDVCTDQRVQWEVRNDTELVPQHH